jgi:hypothetical protein
MKTGNRNPLWYLFADVIGEAISNPPEASNMIKGPLLKNDYILGTLFGISYFRLRPSAII